MKTTLLTSLGLTLRLGAGLALLCPLPEAAAQLPTAPTKVWDRRFGGTSTTCSGEDALFTLAATPDGGCLLGGRSSSDAVGDVSQPNWAFGADFWAVKVDAQGNKQWDARFGGTQIETLQAILPTADGGYLLGGSSDSGQDGDKSQPSQGGNDFWLVKVNAQGVKQWDKRYGGPGSDYLAAIQPTPDGGYLLGGSSQSGSGGDKTEASRGSSDLWVVKIDAQGAKLWDHRFGGSAEEYFAGMKATPDGGCILGGSSLSGLGGDKSEPSHGSVDIWLVKLDATGTKQWDKALGGAGFDGLGAIQVLPGGGYLLGGNSQSNIGDDKSDPHKGGGDMWLLRVDAQGTKLWDRTYGGAMGESITSLALMPDGGYLLAGSSSSGVGGDKTEPSQGDGDYWAVKTDAAGVKQWDKRFGGTLNDNLLAVQLAVGGDVLLGGFTASPIGGDKTQGCWGNVDYWVVKMTAGAPLAAQPAVAAQVGLYPNPARHQVTVRLPAAYAQQPVAVTVHNALGQLLRRTALTPTGTVPLDGLAPGVYEVRLALREGVVSKKLVIE
ncbi:T9SS type A sorting domain-containing protein [Hymenobacter armeniacus]|uniref:T9SS type A sorting domain-containing protein n=1 Tax=Hymenobacter armeniacus TaxID=2771358 RepID=A0ABR8JLX6_9BACT|nr:T9SS type A sorting domain-containing protein [Hymenobacter armeniacus]MBD2720983.1 T9SS type A sorting domain-containing protein [Hymenobacter armeniacus]